MQFSFQSIENSDACLTFLSVSPIATENIDRMGLADKVGIQSGNFFKDAFPKADI